MQIKSVCVSDKKILLTVWLYRGVKDCLCVFYCQTKQCGAERINKIDFPEKRTLAPTQMHMTPIIWPQPPRSVTPWLSHRLLSICYAFNEWDYMRRGRKKEKLLIGMNVNVMQTHHMCSILYVMRLRVPVWTESNTENTRLNSQKNVTFQFQMSPSFYAVRFTRSVYNTIERNQNAKNAIKHFNIIIPHARFKVA